MVRDLARNSDQIDVWLAHQLLVVREYHGDPEPFARFARGFRAVPAECPDLVVWQRAQRRDVGGRGPAPDGADPDNADTQRRFRHRFLHLLALEAEDLVNEDDGDAAGRKLAVDDQDLVNAAVHAIRRQGAGILEREDVLVDATETLLEVGHDLLRPHDEDQSPRTGDVGAELAATGRDREQRS